MSHSNSGSDLPALVVEEVSNRKQLKAFIAFPRRVYQGDPNWVVPLWFEQLHRLTDKNPFFEHAKWQAWVVKRGGEIVGRITAQVDDLHQEKFADGVGHFGMIEAIDDGQVFQLLLQTASGWLEDQGMKRIRGPVNLSMNEECGLLVDGFDTPPFAMMGHGKAYYGARIEAQGFDKAKDLLAYMVRPDFDAPKVMTRLLKSVADKVSVRPIRRKALKDDLEILRDIFADSWSENWGAVPFTDAEFADIGELLAALIDDDFVQIAEVDGKPAAMIVAIPDINDAIKDLDGRLFPTGVFKLLWRLKVKFPTRARVMLMGVRREYENSRLRPALAFLVIDAVRQALIRRGVDQVEMGWVLEDNIGMTGIIDAIGGDAYKRYRIYEKPLASDINIVRS